MTQSDALKASNWAISFEISGSGARACGGAELIQGQARPESGSRVVEGGVGELREVAALTSPFKSYSQ